jgi:hypothetical protein
VIVRRRVRRCRFRRDEARAIRNHDFCFFRLASKDFPFIARETFRGILTLSAGKF